MSKNLALSPKESFALCLSIARIERFVAPAVAANTNPKILHAPVRDELLETSAVRATNMLNSILAHLNSRDAIVSLSARIDSQA